MKSVEYIMTLLALQEARHEGREYTEILISYGRVYSKTKYQWKLRS